MVNRCLENNLCCFTGSRPKDWAKWLSLAEWWYNTCSHSATGLSPFEAVYVVPPPHLLSYVKVTTKLQAVEDQLKSRDQISKLLKENLEAAQNRMKRQANLHRTETSFNEGERLQPYRQASMAMRRNLKLSPRFYGPYKILQKIEQVASKIELPPESKIHPIFHISHLKEKLGHLCNKSQTTGLFKPCQS